MPYILSAPIHEHLPGLWGEGAPYTTENIYSIENTGKKNPPVNYSAHTLKPHSIPHIDAPAHIIPDGLTVDQCFLDGRIRSFYGPVVVLKLQGRGWVEVPESEGVFLWRVLPDELRGNLKRLTGSEEIPQKLFLTAEQTPLTEYGFHDSSYVLVLDKATAEWLVTSPDFNAYGTSWKSSDFEPGSKERPVHKTLLTQAVLFEHLKLDHVPEGRYFLSGIPLYLSGASESPVTPVLFHESELRF